MRIQVDNHRLVDEPVIQENANGQRDVGVHTKSAAFVGGRMMESAAEINGPTMLESKSSGKNGTTGLKSEGLGILCVII
jgi:hypothetical protein